MKTEICATCGHEEFWHNGFKGSCNFNGLEYHPHCKKFTPQTHSQDNRYTEAIANPDTRKGQTPPTKPLFSDELIERSCVDKDFNTAFKLVRKAWKPKDKTADTQTLKTLKDIKADLYVSRKIKNAVLVVPIETLRQEAIKWVKQHRNIKPNWAKETNEEFFMAFFNLTEEELK